MRQEGVRFNAADMVKEFRAQNRTEPYCYRAPWYRAIQWDVVLGWFVGITICACFWYIGIVVAVPTIRKVME